MNTNQPADPETLRLLYEHVRGTPREQLHTQEALDEKAHRNLAAAGVVLALSTLTAAGDPGDLAVAFIAGAVLVFAVLAVLVIVQLRPKEYGIIDDAENVWNSQREQTVEGAMHALVWDAVTAYQVNDALNKAKAKSLDIQLWVLAVEVVLVGLAATVAAAGL